MTSASHAGQRQMAVWLVLLAAAGTFALTMGARQSVLAVGAALIHLLIREAGLVRAVAVKA